jgi:tetratricopeptide (TPR) repeat protein
MMCLNYWGSITMATWGGPEAARWVERADRHAGKDTIERVWADRGIASYKFVTGMGTNQPTLVAEAVRLLDGILDLSRRLGDNEVFWSAAIAWLLFVRASHHAEERLQLALELAERSRTGVSIRTLGTALFFIGDVFLESGQRQRAEECFNEMHSIVERSGQVSVILYSLAAKGIIVFFDGYLEEALEIGQRIRARGEELGTPEYGAIIERIPGSMPALLLGRAEEALRKMESSWAFSVFFAYAGREDEAVAMLERSIKLHRNINPLEDETWVLEDTSLLETAVLLKHRKAAEFFLGKLAGTKFRTTGLIGYLTCIPRHLGAAAALLERYDEAREYYQEAIKVCTEMPFRPELALTRLQLAELLLEHYPKERTEALEHLDFAIKEFREMKMQPSLERALRHKDILKA